MARVHVPITPSVLSWSIDRSGYSQEQVAQALRLPNETLEAWLNGDSVPTLTQARKLASTLRRQLAFFLLPHPPEREIPAIQFRHPTSVNRDRLNPREIVQIRRAARLQRGARDVLEELGQPAIQMPVQSLQDAPDRAAVVARELLGVHPREQLGWPSTSIAFDAWRERLEGAGLLVFLYPIGEDACRGFSLWDDLAPVIAVNTAWNEEARIFTLFHEFGHILTRTSSACVEVRSTRELISTEDSAERWCERFAASLLMPDDQVRLLLRQRLGPAVANIEHVDDVRWLARLFKTSLRATTLRLIELQIAGWDLYRELPERADYKSGGGGGKGRVLREIREDEIGGRTARIMYEGVDAEVLSRSRALELLDIPDADFDLLRR